MERKEQPMHKYAFALAAITILVLPTSLMACDGDYVYDQFPPGIVHFRDGRSPTTAVTGDPGSGDVEGYKVSFIYHDYGPAHAPTPPPTPVQSSKRPSS